MEEGMNLNGKGGGQGGCRPVHYLLTEAIAPQGAAADVGFPSQAKPDEVAVSS